MAQALGSADPLPSPLLRSVVDEMVNTGWIVKTTYFLIPLCGFHMLMRRCVSPDSSSEDTVDAYSRALSSRLSCGQLPMGSLTGFSIPFQLLCWRRHHFGHGPDGSQWIDLLAEDSCKIWSAHWGHIEAPPGGTLYCVDHDMGLNLVPDTDVDAADKLGHPRMASCTLASPSA